MSRDDALGTDASVAHVVTRTFKWTSKPEFVEFSLSVNRSTDEIERNWSLLKADKLWYTDTNGVERVLAERQTRSIHYSFLNPCAVCGSENPLTCGCSN